MKTVQLTQFVHPHGRRRTMEMDLPDDIADLAEKQVLTCECMPNDYSKMVFYSYPVGSDPDEDPSVEEIEIGDNGPGENSPKKTLSRLIQRVAEKTIK